MTLGDKTGVHTVLEREDMRCKGIRALVVEFMFLFIIVFVCYLKYF